jgi:hypothetical protein
MSRIALGPTRKVADLLWLVVVTAVALALLRTTFSSMDGGYLRHLNGRRGSHMGNPDRFWLPFSLFFIIVNGVPQLLLGCFVVVVRSLLRERKFDETRSYGPGFLVSCAAVIASSLSLLIHFSSLSFVFSGQVDTFHAFWSLLVFEVFPNTGYAILGAWIVLVIERRWLPHAGWLDRVGWALAASFLLLFALDQGRLLLESAWVL